MLIEPQDHLRLTVEHLKYQRSILAGMADEVSMQEHEFTDYLLELDGLCRVIASFDVVIKYYEKN